MYVDVGIYGVPPSARPENGDDFNYIECHHKAEKFVREVGGFQALYAQTYQNREEFAQMFDHDLYSKVFTFGSGNSSLVQVREKYGCDKVLPVVYDKVSREART
jgi:delta24-sterol reductase